MVTGFYCIYILMYCIVCLNKGILSDLECFQLYLLTMFFGGKLVLSGILHKDCAAIGCSSFTRRATSFMDEIFIYI